MRLRKSFFCLIGKNPKFVEKSWLSCTRKFSSLNRRNTLFWRKKIIIFFVGIFQWSNSFLRFFSVFRVSWFKIRIFDFCIVFSQMKTNLNSLISTILKTNIWFSWWLLKWKKLQHFYLEILKNLHFVWKFIKSFQNHNIKEFS